MNSKWFAAIVLGVVSAILLVICVLQIVTVWSEVDQQLERTQVSADAQVMADRLDVLLHNMEKHNLTRGHSALVFRSPKNNLELVYLDLSAVRDRALQIAELEKTSTAYQTGLDDMRGTLREITIDGAMRTWKFSPFSWIGAILTVTTVFVALYAADETPSYSRRRY